MRKKIIKKLDNRIDTFVKEDIIRALMGGRLY